MGKIIIVEIDKKQIETIEVNFLCLIPQLRSLHISSYMISILSKTCIEQLNIFSAIYTIGKKISEQYFCKKRYYHRPLNVKQTIDANLIDNKNTTKKAIKEYKSFCYKTRFIQQLNISHYNCENNIPFISQLLEKLLVYNRKVYSIFEIKSQENLQMIFQNPSFHTFILRDNLQNITDMVILFQLNTENVILNQICRNGYIYNCFFDKDDVNYKFDVIERINKYCNSHNIFDMITILDIFGLSEEEYRQHKFLIGNASLYYFLCNIEMIKLEPEKNELVTI